MEKGIEGRKGREQESKRSHWKKRERERESEEY